MTRTVRNGLIVALVHVALVGALFVKLQMDRASYPRVWARTQPVDPDMPIRGRYVQLRIEAARGRESTLPSVVAPADPTTSQALDVHRTVTLAAESGELIAHDAADSEGLYARVSIRDGRPVADIMTPVAFFIAEGVRDPSVRERGEELWVELTIPPSGLPRPIQLGVKRNGNLTPLSLR